MKHIFFLVLSTVLLTLGCGNNKSNQQQRNFSGFGGFNGSRITSVETSPVELGTIAKQVRSYGNVKAQDVVAVTPQTSNRITKIYVDLGDEVEQGQLLAKIYDATFRDQLKQAQAQLEQSKIALEIDSTQLDRQKQLLVKDLISAVEYDNAVASYRTSLAQYESAKASLTQAQENFNNTEVRSPVWGVVIARNLEEGDIASAGQTLFEIANTTGYESRIYLPVQDWQQVKVGQEVNLRVSNETEASTKGVVSRKSPQLDATTGLGEVVITLNEIGPSIYPGVLTENIITISSKNNAVVIPRSTLVEKVQTLIEPESNTIQLQRSYAVFVSKGDSVVERRELELGIEQGDKIEVLRGLRPGEHIVVTGQQGLEDGSSIRVATGENFASPQKSIKESDQPQLSGQPGPPPQGPNRFGNLSEAERTSLREKTKNMSPAERREFMQNYFNKQSADSTSSKR